MDFEKILARVSQLEKIAERSEEQNGELNTLREQIASREKELQDSKREVALLKRNEEFRAIAEEYGAKPELLREHLDGNGTKEEFLRAILADKKEPSVQVSSVRVADEDKMKAVIGQTLAYRMGGEAPDDKTFAHASLVDMARSLNGLNFDIAPDEAYHRSMTTGTLPNLLLSGMNKVLEKEFDEAPVTYKRFVKEMDLPDFRTLERYSTGNLGVMDAISEGSPLNEKQYSEHKEEIKLGSFGNKLKFTREMFINADITPFTTMIGDLAESASRRAELTVYNQLTNGVMTDGTGLYDSSHNNSGDFDLTEDGLASARTLMQRQTASNGTKLFITPKYLVVAPEDEVKARVLIASTGSTNDNKNSGVINPHYGSLEVIVSPFLEAGTWYLMAGRRTITAVYLLGSNRRPQFKMSQASITHTEFEGVFDFNAGIDDYRGFVKAN